MRIRFLFAMLIAVAMTLAPLAMPAAVAAVPDHHDATAMAEHCPDVPRPKQSDHAAKSCCVAGCMALAMLPAPVAEPDVVGGSLERLAPDRFGFGFLGEIATPPPRIA